MRVFNFFVLILVCQVCQICQVCRAQLKISGNIKNLTEKQVLKFNVPFSNWVHEQNDIVVETDQYGHFDVELPVLKPQVFFLRNGKKFIYLYGEPGQTLVLGGSGNDLIKTLRFGGTLGEENTLRQESGLNHYELGASLVIDSTTSPAKILIEIKNRQAEWRTKTADLNSGFSADFKQMLKAEINYFAVAKIWQLIWDLGILTTSYNDPDSRAAWINVLKYAHEGLLISDDSAINSFYYQDMISYYPRFLQLRHENKDSLQKMISTILERPFEEALKDMRVRGKEYWDYTVYKKFLSGKAREAMLAGFLIKCIDNGQLQYQQEGYRRYVADFPSSEFLPAVTKKMKPYLESISQVVTKMDGFEFDTSNADYVNLDDVLPKHRGRVVYIDLWGTWCGPCRDQFRFLNALKDRFKDKPVDFLYIASEHQPKPETYWKEIIKFYNLSGRHLLMGKTLEKYFINLYAGSGGLRFPSYILVDKNGNIINLFAGQPADREKLYEEIEKQL